MEEKSTKERFGEPRSCTYGMMSFFIIKETTT
jgi:hypothetical protein